jgi:sugar phosphate permease
MRYTLLAFLCTITVIAYVQRLALSAPTKIIEGELGLGTEGMGVVLGVWYWGYALAQLPSGWLADRLGSKPALVLFAVVWSVLTALTGLAAGVVGLVVLWGLMGCAQAGIFPCCTKAIGATFPRTGQAFASGGLAASMALGAAVAQWLTAQLLGTQSWQQILAWYAVPGLVWAVAFALAVPRPEAAAPPRSAKERPDAGAAVETIGEVGPVRWSKLATDWQMQLLNAQQFLRAAAVVFFYTWFPRYLKETRGLTEQEAGEFAFWPPFAATFGGLLGGVLSDWVLRRTGSFRLARQGLACVTMVVCVVVAFGAYLATDTALVVFLLSVGAFSSMACGVSAYATAIAYGGRQVAVVFATMNMSGNVGAGLFPFVVGWLVAVTGNWDLALLVFAGLFAAGAVCWALLNPTGTLFGDSGHSQKAGAG